MKKLCVVDYAPGIGPDRRLEEISGFMATVADLNSGLQFKPHRCKTAVESGLAGWCTVVLKNDKVTEFVECLDCRDRVERRMVNPTTHGMCGKCGAYGEDNAASRIDVRILNSPTFRPPTPAEREAGPF